MPPSPPDVSTSNLSAGVVASKLNDAQTPLCKPIPTSAITVNGQTYQIHKDILTKDSVYFASALNGSFKEGINNAIDFDDIDVGDFGFYVDTLYHSAYVPNLELRKGSDGRLLEYQALFGLWRLADRFLNQKIMAIAVEGIKWRLSRWSVDGWVNYYTKYPIGDCLLRMFRLFAAYEYCQEHSLPFEQDVVTACGNCPPQVFAEVVDELDSQFMSEVSKSFALRHADPAVTARKRKRDEKREERGKGNPKELGAQLSSILIRALQEDNA